MLRIMFYGGELQSTYLLHCLIIYSENYAKCEKICKGLPMHFIFIKKLILYLALNLVSNCSIWEEHVMFYRIYVSRPL